MIESCDGMKRTNEAAVQYGYQRRTRELADWARSKRRRYIRKDELLSYLAGKSPPPIHSKVSLTIKTLERENRNENFNYVYGRSPHIITIIIIQII